MTPLLVVVDTWGESVPPLGELVTALPTLSVTDYLQGQGAGKGAARVINLAASYKYLSAGYYVSLLAEARGQRVMPSIRTINDLSRRTLYSLELDPVDAALQRRLEKIAPGGQLTLDVFFGHSPLSGLGILARQVFERFPAPWLQLELRRRPPWQVAGVRLLTFDKLAPSQGPTFGAALIGHAGRRLRRPTPRKHCRYDLAVLINPQEAMPPSDGEALTRLSRVARAKSVQVEFIQAKDLPRLDAFDALFIRETTRLGHHTYRFARRAERLGMPVIDDPESILRCTNKVFLAELLASRGVPAPRTLIVGRSQLASLGERLGFPLVLKIPDGSFSRRVVKADTPMGDGLYGVDLKETPQGVRVIEVNDNPNIDGDVEDAVLGDALYATLVNEFIRRIEGRR
ncbi:MAG: RimK family protein [Candidatus Competibacterales bacterium]